MSSSEAKHAVRMSSSSDRETPKKAVKGKPTKEQSCNDFCCICRCNFKRFYGNFKCRVLAENLFEISNEREWKNVVWPIWSQNLVFLARKTLLNQIVCAPNVPLNFRMLQNLWHIWKVDFLPQKSIPLAWHVRRFLRNVLSECLVHLIQRILENKQDRLTEEGRNFRTSSRVKESNNG